MPDDVSSTELWRLYSRMSEVMHVYEHFHERTGSVGPVVVRWDTAIFQGTRNPTDIYCLSIQKVLREFENLFIHCRQIEPAKLDKFIGYCRSREDCEVGHVALDNANSQAAIGDRYVKCTIQLNGFTFKYWNNDFLPNMSVEVSS